MVANALSKERAVVLADMTPYARILKGDIHDSAAEKMGLTPVELQVIELQNWRGVPETRITNLEDYFECKRGTLIPYVDGVIAARGELQTQLGRRIKTIPWKTSTVGFGEIESAHLRREFYLESPSASALQAKLETGRKKLELLENLPRLDFSLVSTDFDSLVAAGQLELIQRWAAMPFSALVKLLPQEYHPGS